MGDIRRIFVEKKEAFAGEAKNLRHELRSYLGLRGLTGVRILVRYDIENLPDEVWLQAKTTVFSEPPAMSKAAISSRWMTKSPQGEPMGCW